MWPGFFEGRCRGKSRAKPKGSRFAIGLQPERLASKRAPRSQMDGIRLAALLKMSRMEGDDCKGFRPDEERREGVRLEQHARRTLPAGQWKLGREVPNEWRPDPSVAASLARRPIEPQHRESLSGKKYE